MNINSPLVPGRGEWWCDGGGSPRCGPRGRDVHACVSCVSRAIRAIPPSWTMGNTVICVASDRLIAEQKD